MILMTHNVNDHKCCTALSQTYISTKTISICTDTSFRLDASFWMLTQVFWINIRPNRLQIQRTNYKLQVILPTKTARGMKSWKMCGLSFQKTVSYFSTALCLTWLFYKTTISYGIYFTKTIVTFLCCICSRMVAFSNCNY